MVLRNFGTLLRPALTGEPSAPVSALSSLLLGHLDLPPDDVIVVLAVGAVPLLIRVGGH